MLFVPVPGWWREGHALEVRAQEPTPERRIGQLNDAFSQRVLRVRSECLIHVADIFLQKRIDTFCSVCQNVVSSRGLGGRESDV